MEKNNNGNNKSLFLYTALIFFVAIILIILAFFGQTHMDESQPVLDTTSAPQTETTGLTEKASLLSEENTQLQKNVADLQKQIEEKDKQIAELNETISTMNTEEENNILLFHAYQAKLSGKTDDFREIMSTINFDALSEMQKTLYNNLNA